MDGNKSLVCHKQKWHRTSLYHLKGKTFCCSFGQHKAANFLIKVRNESPIVTCQKQGKTWGAFQWFENEEIFVRIYNEGKVTHLIKVMCGSQTLVCHKQRGHWPPDCDLKKKSFLYEFYPFNRCYEWKYCVIRKIYGLVVSHPFDSL